MTRIILALAFVLCAASAHAQGLVVTQPYGVTTQNSSGTIAVTNTFQSIWAASSNTRGRAGCTVQNNGAATQYVFFGPIADATTPTSIKLIAGASVSCNLGGVVLKDQVSITGTANDTFYAGQN